MSKLTDLASYQSQQDLQLCLALVADAVHDIEQGDYDYIKAQLQDILETFDYGEYTSLTVIPENIVPFPSVNKCECM